jgi:hypothetical protein
MFVVPSSNSIQHIFDFWLYGVDPKKNISIFGVRYTPCTTLWLSQNNIMFHKRKVHSYMRKYFSGPHIG